MRAVSQRPSGRAGHPDASASPLSLRHKLGLFPAFSLTTLAVLALVTGTAVASPGSGKLYGTDGSGGNLYTIDPATGASVLIGRIGAFPVPGLAVDPTTGVMYASRGGGTPELYRIDPATGAATLVGNTGLAFSAVPDLEFDRDGTLYAAVNISGDGGSGGDNLAVIDKLTGRATVIGPFGGLIGLLGGTSGIEAIAFAPDGRLFGASAVQSSTSGVPTLYTLNKTTGLATRVASIVDANNVAVAGGVSGMHFACDGTLYGGTGAATGNLIRINPGTGVFTFIGHSVNRSLAALAFQIGCGCRALQLGGALGWTTKAPLPVGHGGAAGVAIGSRIYVTHGSTAAGGDTADTYVFDRNTGSWAGGPPAPSPKSDLVGVCVEDAGGQALVFTVGGRSGGAVVSTVEVFSPLTSTWSTRPPMPTPRRGPGAAFVPGIGVAGGRLGTVYVLGGGTGPAPHTGVPLPANQAFDMETGTWVSRAPMPRPVMDIYATTYFPGTGRIYVFGGFDGASVTNSVQIYDPVLDTWSLGRAMPTPRSSLIAGVCGARIYVIGGFNGVSLDINESYDPFTDRWFAPEPSKPSPASGMASQSIYTGAEIIAIGSRSAGGGLPTANDFFTCGARPAPCFSDADCSNGLFCDGAETCDVTTGQCHSAPPFSCDDGNPCTSDSCDEAADTCRHTPLADGVSCSDGNVCNGAETCHLGQCASGTPLNCNDNNPCTTDSCNSQSGCVNAQAPDGTTCNDGNACTQNDKCLAGSCAGGPPVVCTASNQCHDAGTCNPTTGLCSNPAKPDGTTCNDGSACTQSDTCRSGVCTGSNPVTCTALDQCHGAGTCDPTTGTCSNPAKPDGTSCNDGNACTQSDKCESGQCVGTNPVACTALDQCHVAGTCDPTTGMCTNPAKPDGTICSDGNACTQTDKCESGQCVGSNPVTCTALDQCHVAGTCDPTTGACSNPAKADGTTCSDGNACTQRDTCESGQCVGTNPVTCTASDQCHEAGTCDPTTGMCSNPAKPDGTSCSDGNACTQTDKCESGQCVGTNPVTCSALDQCHDAGTCDPTTGMCSNPARPDGTTCNDGNACTQSDKCESGQCVGTNPVTCTALDQCHVAGTCDPTTGMCSDPARPDGTSCSDGNACTQTDTCRSGVCTGSNPVTCAALDQCHEAGTCDPTTGVCSNPAKPDGTSCSDGNACTVGDACSNGTCAGGTPVVCTPLDQCHDAGTCDPTTGMCSNPAKPDGTTCDDGNACTVTDRCQAGSCNGSGTASSARTHVLATGWSVVQCGDVTPSFCVVPTVSHEVRFTFSDGRTYAFVIDLEHDASLSSIHPVRPRATEETATGAAIRLLRGDFTPYSTSSYDLFVNGDTAYDGIDFATPWEPAYYQLTTEFNETFTFTSSTGQIVASPGVVCETCAGQPDGTVCNDGNACTQSDKCESGQCVGSNPVACTALDQCHVAGTCDPTTGMCTNPVKPDGTACDDGQFCTLADTCQAGRCGGSQVRSCDDGNPCTADRCDEALKACTHVAVADSESAAGADGVCNTADDNLELFGPDGACGSGDDGSGDGLCDAIDNCPSVFNPDQRDADADGAGDRCDATPCPAGLVMSVPERASGLPGTTAVVPVELTDVSGRGVLSADVTLVFNPAVVRARGVALGTLAGACSLTVNLTQPGAAVVSVFCTTALNGSGPLLEVSFDVVGGLGQGSPIRIARGVLNEGTPAVCTDDGTFVIPAAGNIAGHIIYYRDHLTGTEPSVKPVPGAVLSLTGTGPAVPDSATTDGAGAYLFSEKPLGASYTLVPGKVDDFRGAVSSFDAALNAQAVVGILALTPSQLLAADVSGNGAISSFDSALMAQFAVGLLLRFPVAERLGSDWFMVPVPAPVPNQTVTPPNPAAGVQGHIAYAPLAATASNQDFLAGLFGDISGNYVAAAAAPAAGGGTLALAASSGTTAAGPTSTTEGLPQATRGTPGDTGARLSVSSGVAAPGETVRVAVAADGAEKALAFDLMLNFDPAVLRPLQVELGQAAASFTLTPNVTEPGRVRIGLFDSRPLGGRGEIAVVSFQVVGRKGDESPLSLEAAVDEGRIAATVKDGKVRVRSGR